jgi:iron complex outermembrane receptor protein
MRKERVIIMRQVIERILKRSCAPAAVACLLSSTAFAGEAPDGDDFTSMSLEDLMAVEVTTASKRPELVGESAAAVFVLTREDIQRSGAVTLADALRLVPGVNVAKINANSWAVSVRGFNSRFANKLLVMIDGRTVFTPLFSGVLWDQHNIVIEDIEKIEVVRGPGGTLWGANAVNGVINIITRSSEDTKGTLVQVAGGDEFRAQAVVRHGGDMGDNGSYRLYGKFEAFDEGVTAAGGAANDDWRNFRGGFRTDHQLSAEDSLMVSGEVGVIDSGETNDTPLFTAPYLQRQNPEISRIGAHILGRWTRSFSERSELSVQAYADYSKIEIPQGEESRLTLDLAAQHAFSLGERHDVLWGFGFRNISDDIKDSALVSFADPSRSVQIYNGFLQDTVKVTDAFDVIVGAKFEHNGYTGFEIQPSARFLWRADEAVTVWGAVSRAVRTPSRAEDGIIAIAAIVPPTVPPNPSPVLPLALRFTGDKSIDSESLIAYELGVRVRLGDTISVDTTGFFNKYDELRGSRIGSAGFSTTPVPHLVLPLTVDELVQADAHGVETVVDWQVRPNWRLQATYSYLQIKGDVPVGPTIRATAPGGSDPEHSATLRSLLDIGGRVRLDTALRYVDELVGPNIDSYVAVDARLAWRATDNIELAVTGRNLTNDDHFEFGVDASFATVPTASERSVFATVSAKF